jgi:hypothetical protein
VAVGESGRPVNTTDRGKRIKCENNTGICVRERKIGIIGKFRTGKKNAGYDCRKRCGSFRLPSRSLPDPLQRQTDPTVYRLMAYSPFRGDLGNRNLVHDVSPKYLAHSPGGEQLLHQFCVLQLGSNWWAVIGDERALAGFRPNDSANRWDSFSASAFSRVAGVGLRLPAIPLPSSFAL